MAKKDFGKGLKERLQATVEAAKAAANEVDLSDVKAKLSETADYAKSAVKEVTADDVKPEGCWEWLKGPWPWENGFMEG